MGVRPGATCAVPVLVLSPASAAPSSCGRAVQAQSAAQSSAAWIGLERIEGMLASRRGALSRMGGAARKRRGAPGAAGSNKVCVHNICRLPCHINNDCYTGLVCIDGGCMGCTADSQCNPGDVCGPNGQCVPGSSGGCSSNSDCSGGQVCVGGSCQACSPASQGSPGQGYQGGPRCTP